MLLIAGIKWVIVQLLDDFVLTQRLHENSEHGHQVNSQTMKAAYVD